VKLPSLKRSSVPADERIPRGAIIVVAIGLLATIAAAVLTGGGAAGDAAHLEWVQHRAFPDSKPVAVPGNAGKKMQIVNGLIKATGTNTSGYSLFAVQASARFDDGVKFEEGSKLVCSVHATGAGTLIAQSTGGLRMTYPRKSETGIYGQPVEEAVVAGKFASHGHPSAILEVSEDLPERYTTVQGVKLEWPHYEVGTENIEFLLPKGTPKAATELTFLTIWKTTRRPVADVSCKLDSKPGTATVQTKAELPHVSPPIDEEAEEIKEAEREENGEEPAEPEGE
jgi:hypothetical protein